MNRRKFLAALGVAPVAAPAAIRAATELSAAEPMLGAAVMRDSDGRIPSRGDIQIYANGVTWVDNSAGPIDLPEAVSIRIKGAA